MKLIEFPEQTMVIAKDQPPYKPFPCWHQQDDPKGRRICCWKLTWMERLTVLFTGKLWHHVLTFNERLQPQLIQVTNPFQGG